MPPMRTNIVEIGEAVEARLNLLEAVPDPSQILWSARKGDLPHIKGKKDLVIRPRKGQDIASYAVGGGRHAMVCLRVIDVIMRTSYGGSEVASDKTWIEQHTDFEDAVLNALAGQMLPNLNNLQQEYLTAPIKYLGTTEETREEGDPSKRLWGNSVHSFEFHFKPKLDLSQLT